MGSSSAKPEKPVEGKGQVKIDDKKVKTYVFAPTAKWVEDDFVLGKQIGQPGAFGHARVATEKATGKQFAIKFMKKKQFHPNQYDTIRSEIDILRQLDHPNILKGVSCYENDEQIAFVMECLNGGELFDRISELSVEGKTLSEKDAADILRQVFQGIKYLHERKIAHCDLKPDNMLFVKPGSSDIKIIDFGLSKFAKPRTFIREQIGTYMYMAPEVIRREFRESCDMWSMGVITFTMVFGYPPFNTHTMPKGRSENEFIISLIERGFTPEIRDGYGAHFPRDRTCSAACRDFIAKLLDMRPSARPTAVEALQHPWLRGEAADTKPLPIADVLSHLNPHAPQTRLKNALLGKMAGYLKNSDVDTLARAFQQADTDGSGFLTREELVTALRTCGFSGDVEAFHAMDADGDGKISQVELLNMVKQQRVMATEERLLREFKKLDKNGDGRLSAHEMTEVLGKTQEEVTAMMQEVDQNSDGMVDYDEFLAIWLTREECSKLMSA